MNSIKRLKLVWLGAFLTVFAMGNANALNCQTSDFTSGAVSSDQCRGMDGVNDNAALINTLWSDVSTTWSLAGKYDHDSGNEAPFYLKVTGPAQNGAFNWESTSALVGKQVLFTVKQGGGGKSGGGFISYLFNDLPENAGKFFTEFSFGKKDYSHVSIYTNNSRSVPELDGASAGLALGLMMFILAMVRERRA